MSKLWGGRFASETDALVFQFNASIDFDKRLYDQDIEASTAWAKALARADILLQEEADTILAGLVDVS